MCTARAWGKAAIAAPPRRKRIPALKTQRVKKCGALSCGFEWSNFENRTEVQFDPPTSEVPFGSSARLDTGFRIAVPERETVAPSPVFLSSASQVEIVVHASCTTTTFPSRAAVPSSRDFQVSRSPPPSPGEGRKSPPRRNDRARRLVLLVYLIC